MKFEFFIFAESLSFKSNITNYLSKFKSLAFKFYCENLSCKLSNKLVYTLNILSNNKFFNK